jgi:hypothetical protein
MAAAFARQARACAALGSPFMARALPLLGRIIEGGTGPVAVRLLTWPGDPSAMGDAVPLRLAGALHALVLTRADAGLMAAYPPHEVSDDGLEQALAAAIDAHSAPILAWLDQPPQTNEVRRSVVLLAGAAWVQRKSGLPLRLSELGASAGLNLHFDAYNLAVGIGSPNSPVTLTPQWEGPQPEATPINVVERAGVDLNPLDPSDPDQALRLLAYLWPDQPGRAALTQAAIALARTRPDRGDAAGWLEARLATPRPGTVHMVYHTIAWQYFPPETADRCRAAITAAGASATIDAPLAHLAMEADDSDYGAALTVQYWPSGQETLLARVDFHGRWIKWLAD